MVSSILNVIAKSYSPQPTALQKAGRIGLTVLNVAAAAGPLIEAFQKPSKCTWLEVVGSDSQPHVLALATLTTSLPTWPSMLTNAYRVAVLASGLSTFPAPTPALDLVVHAANLISPFVL